jgi:hypothetical protein
MSFGLIVAYIKAGLFGTEGSLEIHSPTAVASVRGTEFAVEINGVTGANVGVFNEGKVTVRNPYTAGEVFLVHNQETSILNGRSPELPRKLEHFVPQRAKMYRIRKRAMQLRRQWRPMPRATRERIRRELLVGRRKVNHPAHDHEKQIRTKPKSKPKSKHTTQV